MMTWRAVGSGEGRPKRVARSTIGSTVPRRLMTPRTWAGACGQRGLGGPAADLADRADVDAELLQADAEGHDARARAAAGVVGGRRRAGSGSCGGSFEGMRGDGGGGVAGRGGGGSGTARACAPARVRPGEQRVEVEDQRHPPVAEDGRGGDAGDGP